LSKKIHNEISTCATYILTSWILLCLNTTLQGKEKPCLATNFLMQIALLKGQCLATRDCV